MTNHSSALDYNVSGISDVIIECKGISSQSFVRCSFNHGPLHPCENIALSNYC